MLGPETIRIRGARVHNLKNIDVDLPRDAMIVLTGPSGSGKSSLAFDTIYSEGQRRYIESLSAYARQFLEQVSKPDLDLIEGLSPTISIEQKTTGNNPRSTVGTITEIYDYLRVLFARIGKPVCYSCKSPIRSQTPQQIADTILDLEDGSKIALLAPVVRSRKGEYQKELLALRQRGFVRARIDGKTVDLSETIVLDRNKKHDIDVFVDRLIIKGDKESLSTRVSDSVELALKLGDGQLIIQRLADKETAIEERLVSERFACSKCDINYPSPEPRTFSFNSPMGACPSCEGIGTESEDEESDQDDATDDDEAPLFRAPRLCSDCNGARLRIESRHFFIGEKSIIDWCDESLSRLETFVRKLKLDRRDALIADRLLKETLERLEFLNRVGVGYLSLSRPTQTLSGGEAQRIRLATQIGSALVGVIYVLDEPSIGLHARDTDRLLATLEQLRDQGNTVIVVEHDRETIEKADYIVDLGPGAGSLGGNVVAAGSRTEILASRASLTGKYLRGDLKIEAPKTRRKPDLTRAIEIRGASIHNLKRVDAIIPLGLLTCVTGVSGSGKSSLVVDTLYPHLMKAIYGSKIDDVPLTSISGVEHLDKVIDIDQRPIGRTPRSNPATYTGLFTMIRDLFAGLPEAKARGYAPGRFSFNVKGGRCEVCEGDGVTTIEMHFLPDVFVECQSCKGKRYNAETLDIRYREKSIADVLEMTIDEACSFFDAIPWIRSKLETLCDVGLGYLKLGQSSTTLSGGESQRIKLARELSRRSTGKTLYILDEPSTGLHFDDIKKLVSILQRLVDQGNSVLVVEHNLDIVKVADWVLDMGPEGGEGGGELLAQGPPEKIAATPRSHTGRFLKSYL